MTHTKGPRIPEHYCKMVNAVRDGDFGFLFNHLTDFAIVQMIDPALDIFLEYIQQKLDLDNGQLKGLNNPTYYK